MFVGCGSTVDSSVTLDADLTCTDTTGLVIGSDKVTVNLNGHTITDTLGGGDGETGIAINGYSKVKIKNGTIENFARGIYSGEGTADNTVQGVTIWLDGNNDCDFSLYGIYLEDTFKTQIKNVTVNNSGAAVPGCIGDGSEYLSVGIFSENSNQLTVSNSTLNDVFNAFFDVEGYFDKWSNNTANVPYDLWNGEDPATGFTDLFGYGNSFIGDTANGGTTGFRLISEGNWVQMLKNSTAGNSNDGAYMFASFFGTNVTGNTFNGNGNEGMHGAFNYGMAFSKNTAILNGFDPLLGPSMAMASTSMRRATPSSRRTPPTTTTAPGSGSEGGAGTRRPTRTRRTTTRTTGST